MNSFSVELYQAQDGDETYAIRLPSDPPDTWRCERGYGGKFVKVWTVEFQNAGDSNQNLDWDALLTRTIEAYRLSDPVVTSAGRAKNIRV